MKRALRARWESWAGLLLCVASFGGVLGLVGSALARPGGGQTFGSGSGDDYSGGGSGGDGGGDGGELIMLLIRLVFYYPKLGIPLLLIAAFIWWRMRSNVPEAWATSHVAHKPDSRVPSVSTPVRSGQLDFGPLLKQDPDFSRVVFEDFAYRLYASTYRARANPKALQGLAPYLADSVRAEVAAEPPTGLAASGVVVAALRIVNHQVLPPREGREAFNQLAVVYESNITLGTAPQERTYYRRERWVFERAASARTQPPEQTEKLGCPNCGAPFTASDDRRCAYCHQVVTDGRFAWQVVALHVLESVSRPPALTTTVEERGTALPTVRDASVQSRLAELLARDPTMQWAAFEARVRHVYAELNRGYSACELSPIRGGLSDGMYDALRYWVEAYQVQGLRNVLEDMSIERLEPVKVVCDRYFDAITVRLWARGRDYTVEAKSGRVVTGSPQALRQYSEYWTFIRGASVRGAPRVDGTCPNCAAPLAVTMAGQCGHCGSHITRGEFDWVLSKIEQDDVYAG